MMIKLPNTNTNSIQTLPVIFDSALRDIGLWLAESSVIVQPVHY